MTDDVQALEQAIESFLDDINSQDSRVISASRVINPLLAIWGHAHDIDSAVAVPVEQLLTVLTGRKLTTPSELARTMGEVRVALADSDRLTRV